MDFLTKNTLKDDYPTALKIADLMNAGFIAKTDEEADKLNKEIDILRTKLDYLRKKRIEFIGR